MEYGVELPLIFTCVNGEQKPCLLPFFIERTSSPQGILGINAISNIDIHVGTSYNFFRISKTFESVIPSSPISLNINNGSGKIQGISLSNGIYSFATRGNQTNHAIGCVHAHDPRLKCLQPITTLHKNFGIATPSLISDDEIQPHHLRLIGNKIVNLPDIVHRENYGTLTWVSPYVQPTRSTVEVRPNFHSEPNSSLPEILEDKLINIYNEHMTKNYIIGTDQLNSIYLNTKEIKYSRDIKSDVFSHVYFINRDAKCFSLVPNCCCPTLSCKT